MTAPPRPLPPVVAQGPDSDALVRALVALDRLTAEERAEVLRWLAWRYQEEAP